MNIRFVWILLFGALVAKGADAPFRNGFMYHDDLHEVAMRDLDGLPIALPLSPIEYPAELRSTDYVGDIWVTAAVRSDGTVQWAAAFRGNNRAFELPVNRAVKAWRFTPPQKNGRPVAAFLDFRVIVSKASPAKISLGYPAPNQSTDPAFSSGTPAAVQPARHP